MNQILDFIAQHWEAGIGIAAILYELGARFIKTEKNRSLLDLLIKVITVILPNRDKNNTRHNPLKIIILFMLFSGGLFAQTNSIYKGSASVNADSAVFKNVVSNLQGTYGDVGALYYNRESSKWRIFYDSAWHDLIQSGGGGGGSLLFADNGLSVVNDTVKWGGALLENTTVNASNFNVTIDNIANLNLETSGTAITSTGNDLLIGASGVLQLLADPSLSGFTITDGLIGDFDDVINLTTESTIEFYKKDYGQTFYLDTGTFQIGDSNNGAFSYSDGDDSYEFLYDDGQFFEFFNVPDSMYFRPSQGVSLTISTDNGTGGNAGNIRIQPGGDDGASTNAGSLFLNAGGLTGAGNPGNIYMNTQQGQLIVSSGLGGRDVLVAGEVTINNSAVTATSNIIVTCQVPGGTIGFLYISARTPGTSFTVTSSNALDTSTISWFMFDN